MRARLLSLLALLPTLAAAFSPAITTTDGVRLEIPEQPPWTELEQPRQVAVKITNQGAEPISGEVRLGLTDDWRVDGEPARAVSVPPGQTQELAFGVVMGRGTYRAFYPIHATATLKRGQTPVSVHSVLVVKAEPPGEGPGGRGPSRAVTALKAAGPINVDGRLDEWANAASLALTAADASVGAPGPADFAGRIALLWDSKALYLSVEATDDLLSGRDHTSRDLVDSDHVRLTISRRPEGRQDDALTADDLVLVLAPIGPGNKPQAKIARYDGLGRGDFELGAVKLAAAKDATGWTLEAALPWAALGVQPEAGAAYGFNLFLGDTDQGTRESELTLGGTAGTYWTDPRMFVPLRLSDLTRDPSGASLPTTVLKGPAVVPLARLRPGQVLVVPDAGAAYAVPAGQTQDPASRTTLQPGYTATRGEARESISFHPPWAGGVKGGVAADYRLVLPALTPIRFESGVAIRDSRPEEGASDGVTFKVQVAPAGGEMTTLVECHTAAKSWETLTADLSAYAGQTITLRLLGHPGPRGNTSCDNGYWGAPVVRAGRSMQPEPAAAREARRTLALEQAARLAGRNSPAVPVAQAAVTFAARVKNEAGLFGVSVVPGPLGLLDAQIAVVGQESEAVYEGFAAQVSSLALADRLVGERPVETRRDGEAIEVTHHASYEGTSFDAVARIEVRDGALRIGWSMPGLQRDRRGHPRYSLLHLGPSSMPSKRVYFGHGHVVTGVPRMTLGYGGFAVSTRYIGVDYDNGLALVQAAEPVPDRLEHDQAARLTSLVAHHDATFTLVPSEKGAFAAARVWRLGSGLRAAPGVAAIRGKMCIDQWGGDYAQAAEGLKLATAYGLDEAVFVKHVWQRWGYDYRLPDIYPPAGDRAAFDAMVAAAKANGRLFALHDNYIDIYPDATDFTFDLVSFNEDGTPRRAWFNEGRQAQSYKWDPTRFLPFLEANEKIIDREIDPTAYFIDVWSAAPPVDHYGRGGDFRPKMVDQAASAKGFDRTRELIGGPTISEAGHDALIGHLDAAQADHLTATREGGRHVMRVDFQDWDRTPWFDMGHHGRFVLFAGGLGGRYQADRPTRLAGYGSDDYLTTTVLGGRTPMCDGPFYRRTVMTYWLLQPLCAELERQEMLAQQFAGDDLHRQVVSWSDGKVTVNRGDSDWTTEGVTLPSFGFVAEAAAHRADISRRDGVISAMAQSPGMLFVDARPPDDYGQRLEEVTVEVRGFKDLGNRRFQIDQVWDIRSPLPATVRPFVHATGPLAMMPGITPNSDILFQPPTSLTPEMLTRSGRYEVSITGTLPEQLLPGEIVLKYGLYDPARGGPRLLFNAIPTDGDRFSAGSIAVAGSGPATKLTWTAPEAKPTGIERDNVARKLVDFGPVRTNGALRLRTAGETIELTLLPGSKAAEVELRLAQLAVKGRQVAALEQLGLDGSATPATATVREGVVSFTTAPGAFRYRLRLR